LNTTKNSRSVDVRDPQRTRFFWEAIKFDRLKIGTYQARFLVPSPPLIYNFPVMDDFGLDMEEVTKVIESAQVLVVRFAIVDKRLLVDTRTSEKEGPFIGVVPKAGSVEERFKSLKRLRPRFPLPEKIMSFMWPRHMETFRMSGLWNRIEERLVTLGGEPLSTRCNAVFDELISEEKTEVLAAIRGSENYQSLWERPR
jgi:hypothetical protein